MSALRAIPVALLLALAPLLGACAAPSPTPTSTPTPQLADAEALFGTTVLREGSQRISFLLVTGQDIVRAPSATVTATHLEGDGKTVTAETTFHGWPFGVRGAYSGDIAFDRPGRWQLDIVAADDAVAPARAVVEVAEESRVVDVGALPPFANNRTLEDVEDIAELTSDPTPDPQLYTTTIGEAVISDKPSLIVFATPALCTSPTCGPQVDTVSEVREEFGEQANFIHVEVYDNPADIQGDLTRAVYSPLVERWGFTSIPHWTNESWVYLMGRDARIAARFEGYVTATELAEALRAAL